jgi:putative membrane protein
MTEKRRRPAAFHLDETGPDRAVAGAAPVIVVEEPAEPIALPAVAAETLPPPPGRFTWRRLFFGAASGLVTLGIGLWLDGLIRDLFARADWLGWLGLGFLALALLAVAVMAGREIAGVLRLRRIDGLHRAVADAALADDEPAARRLAADLSAFYAGRASTARGRAALAAHMREVIEGRDLLVLAERELLAPLDDTARSLVLESAKRVSVVTAISPRAIVDLLFVIVENLRLIRRLADLYGGRPGTLGFMGLAGRAVTHLGVTGGMAIGDTLVQQLVGQGLAARLSSRLGEGVVNGLLTARLGLAALDLVRPMPFLALPRPKIGDIVGELTRFSSAPEKPARGGD